MSTRSPAVAGTFYPARDRDLRQMLDELFEQRRPPSEARTGVLPKALIAPHAGYIYSGPIAASAYGLIEGARQISRVILIGPSHHVPLAGLAVPASDAFRTPLGDIPLDREAIEEVLQLHQVSVQEEAHLWEHSLEVQLPFLQRVLGDFTLVPLVAGHVSPEHVAEVLDRLWGGDETLIVISSDLSHYHSYEQACAIDGETSRAILASATDLSGDQACGSYGINGLLCLAGRLGMRIEEVDRRNSGDTAGPRGQVVGYGAYALYNH